MANVFPNPDGQFNRKTAVEAGRKGGTNGKGSHSLTRSLSHKIRYYQKKGMSDENAQEMYEFFMDSKVGLTKAYILIEKMLSMSTTTSQFNMGVQRMLEMHKQIHGTINKNLNVNTSLDRESVRPQFEEFMKRAKKEEMHESKYKRHRKNVEGNKG